MYTRLNKRESVRLDVADYTGPAKVIDIVDKGKGMVVTRDVEPGELLLAAKAFSISYGSEHGRLTRQHFNTLTNEMEEKPNTLVPLTINTIINVKNNPKMGKDLYSLYAGNTDRNVDLSNGLIDAYRIGRICKFNSFSTVQFCRNVDKASGLWILPALINHSCHFNTKATFFGDIMCFRPVKTLKANEEITIPYIDVTLSLDVRKKFFERYNFVCKCTLCEIDRNDPNYTYRQILINEKHMAILNQRSLVLLQKFIDEIKGTFVGSRDDLKYQLIGLLESLAELFKQQGDYRSELSTYGEILSIVENSLDYISIVVLVKMADIYLSKMSRPKLAKNRLAKAIEKSKILHGATKEIFKSNFLAQKNKLSELV
jgi:hypothetical protein